MKFIKAFTIALSLLTFLLPESQAGCGQIVRLACVTNADQIKLRAPSRLRIFDLTTNKQLYSERYLFNAQVLPAESGIKIGERDLKTYGIRIQPDQDSAIYLNGRKFKGAIEIIRQPDKKLLAINYLDLEDYVCGVLRYEVSPWWPMEALEAQAIISRTFGLYQTKINAAKNYDLVSTTYSQLYKGNTAQRGRIGKAVRLTRGKVLTYKEKLFPSFYHSSCAGHTENSANLWKINLIPLQGRECQFCQGAPHSKWQARISFKDIQAALEKAGFKFEPIKSMKIIDRDISARITDLELTSASGKMKISANRFRLLIGPEVIRSTNFKLRLKGPWAYLQGEGWGHGVGLCQWGAFFMARKGFNAEQILGYYYPESKLRNIEEIKNEKGQIETF